MRFTKQASNTWELLETMSWRFELVPMLGTFGIHDLTIYGSGYLHAILEPPFDSIAVDNYDCAWSEH